jgi:phage/plasmid-associated DNA primase
MATQTITEEIVRKVERYDAEVMEVIRHDKDLPQRYLRNLKDYHDNKRAYSYKEVIYEFPDAQKQSRLGRVYVKKMSGLQGFPSHIRNPLLDRHNWDCDMENAHYHLVKKLARDWGNLPTTAIQHYIDHREECLEKLGCPKKDAKTLYLKAMYGGQIDLYNEHYRDETTSATGDLSNIQAVKLELEAIATMCWGKFPHYRKYAKKTNSQFSLLSLMVQTEERKCLFEVDKYMSSVGRSVTTLIHDGCAIEKLEGETEFPEKHLRLAEAAVLAETGHTIRLVAKRFQHDYKVKKDDTLIDSRVTISDAWAAERFVEIMGDTLVKDNDEVWVFNTSNGTWTNRLQDIKDAVTQCGDKLIFRQDQGGGVKIYDYSGSVSKTNNLIEKLKSKMIAQDNFFIKRISSDVGKLLFPDGIYDFKTGVFTPEFDRNIIFRYVMPYPFPARDEALISKIRHNIFGVGEGDEPFNTQSDSDTLRHSLMRAMIGDNNRKKATLGQGQTNSGKGALMTITATAFGQWVGTFEGNSLLFKSFVGETERENTFMMSFVDRRFAFSSEITINKNNKIDSNKFKQITSGGTDPIKMRRLNENAVSRINKATVFMFAQAFPDFHPPDGAMKERIRSVVWGKSYVDNPVETYERKKDANLIDYYKKEECGIALFWVLVDTYEEWRQQGFEEPERTDEEKDTQANLVPVFNFRKILLEEFVLTGKTGLNPDFVPFQEIQEYMEANGFTEGRGTLSRYLKDLKLPSHEKKIGKKCVSVRLGIRRKTDEDE